MTVLSQYEGNGENEKEWERMRNNTLKSHLYPQFPSIVRATIHVFFPIFFPTQTQFNWKWFEYLIEIFIEEKIMRKIKNSMIKVLCCTSDFNKFSQWLWYNSWESRDKNEKKEKYTNKLQMWLILLHDSEVFSFYTNK